MDPSPPLPVGGVRNLNLPNIDSVATYGALLTQDALIRPGIHFAVFTFPNLVFDSQVACATAPRRVVGRLRNPPIPTQTEWVWLCTLSTSAPQTAPAAGDRGWSRHYNR